jgi:sugar/nucleoside kinase (ribokinase family)
LGSEGALALDHRNHEDRCPALTLEVCDTTGASDAHFTLAALSSLAGLPLEVGSLLGNLAGGLAANVLGNAQPVQRSRLLKFATTVMKI